MTMKDHEGPRRTTKDHKGAQTKNQISEGNPQLLIVASVVVVIDFLIDVVMDVADVVVAFQCNALLLLLLLLRFCAYPVYGL